MNILGLISQLIGIKTLRLTERYEESSATKKTNPKKENGQENSPEIEDSEGETMRQTKGGKMKQMENSSVFKHLNPRQTKRGAASQHEPNECLTRVQKQAKKSLRQLMPRLILATRLPKKICNFVPKTRRYSICHPYPTTLE